MNKMNFEKQQYQTDCVNNIIQALNACDVRNNDFSNLPNAINDLWQEKKYTQFQKNNKKRLDVLMETGTGKTFTYLKTIFEIHKQFNKKKIIIVVPRTAIKLGVIQNIKLTADYFFNEYRKHLKYIDYPKDGLSKITHDFLTTDDLCILITTNSAFNSDKNKINQTSENIQPTLFKLGSTWEGIKNQNPIIIIDEPHLLKGIETQKGLDKLDNCLQIRFGATFPKDKEDKAHHLSNVVYSLDSISAFNEFLVKRIRVDTVVSDSEVGDLKLIETKAKSNKFMVVYDINQVIHKREIYRNEDIGAKTGLADYNGVSAKNITTKNVFLDNKTTLELQIGSYQLGDEEIRQMIRQTIKTHFEKEESLFSKDIKTLSLFFIPKIEDFRSSENNLKPRVKTIFEEEYKNCREKKLKKTKNKAYKEYLQNDFNEEGKLQVHEGYFSGDKVSKKDKNAGLNKDDLGVNIILNEKEKLLSFDTPLRFIFSVWALQEGWDNPNIFNICKLSGTKKDISRRQQVGRGLRISINDKGNRLTYRQLNENEEAFYHINTLDMVVSGKEKEFIQQIQQEIQQASYSLVGDTLSLEVLKEKGLSDVEANTVFTTIQRKNIIDKYGKIQSSIYEFLKSNRSELDIVSDFQNTEKINEERYNQILKIFTDNKQSIIDKNKKTKQVKIRQEKWQEFQELWETINKESKIVYKGIKEKEIIEQVAKTFNKENITPIQTKIYKKVYNIQKDRIEKISENTEEEINFFKTHKFIDFINFFVKDEKLPFAFMMNLLNAIDTKKIINNPSKAKERLLTILKESIHGSILNQVSYQFSETSIYPNSLQNQDGIPISSIKHTLLGNFYTNDDTPQHLLYDTICYDSDIEKEIQQNDPAQINHDTVTVFAKLPKISIPTPYKKYSPDFAYLIEKEDQSKLFLVVESKGYENESDIPSEEQKKIDYAKKFFTNLQTELPNIEIKYETRISKQSLIDLINGL